VSEFLTPLEAAHQLKTTRNTIYRWMRAGRLPALKVGGVWRIPRSALELRRGPVVGSAPVRGRVHEWSEVLDRLERAPHSHWVVVTGEPEEVYDVDASFLRRGLAGDRLVVKGYWCGSEDEVRRALRARGLDVEGAERAGRLVFLAMHEEYRLGGLAGVLRRWEELWDRARRLGLRGMWKTGSPVLDDRAPFEAVAQVEDAAAAFFDRPGAHAICPVHVAPDPRWHARLTRLLGAHGVAVYRADDRATLLSVAS
jgi:excisionase family DNA binding protein